MTTQLLAHANGRRSPASDGVPFTVVLDPARGQSLFRQLHDAIRSAVLAGTLTPGTKLPSTRALAAELEIGRNTVALAYDYLQAEGFVTTKVGSGTYVNSSVSIAHNNGRTRSAQKSILPAASNSQRRESLTKDRFLAPPTDGAPRPFRLGEPGTDVFPAQVWARLLSRNARRATAELLTYGDANGYRHLRRALLEHVSAARGVHAELPQVFLVRGAQQAIDLIARVLLSSGDTAWVEDPGYLTTRSILDANGVRLVPVPVDQDGLIVDEAMTRAREASAVFVTPSNHFPLGATLSLRRRLRLLDWAQQRGAWVIEDDYDSEFRYSGRPLPCMQGLDRSGVVLYVGTFSKTMFPALRLGYLIVPPSLVKTFERARDRFDMLSPSIEQAALADFMARGEYARHVRRMRELYRDRQAFLVTEAQTHLAEWLHLPPVDVGMQMIAWLRPGLCEKSVVQVAADVGVEVRPLSLYSLENHLPPALVLGFAAYPEASTRSAVLRLATVLNATM